MDRLPASLTLVLVALAGCSTLSDEHAFARENQQRDCLRLPTVQIEPCLQRAEAEYAVYKSQSDRERERNAEQAVEGAQADSTNDRIRVP